MIFVDTETLTVCALVDKCTVSAVVDTKGKAHIVVTHDQGAKPLKGSDLAQVVLTASTITDMIRILEHLRELLVRHELRFRPKGEV